MADQPKQDKDHSGEPEVIIPEELPLLPVRDVVVFTSMILPLFVGRQRSVRAIEEALANDRLISIWAKKEEARSL